MSSDTRISKEVEALIGSSWWEIIQYLYLMAKYQTSCVFLPITFNPMTEQEYSAFTEKGYGGLVSLTWVCGGDSRDCFLYTPSVLKSRVGYTNYLRECITNSERLAIIPLELHVKGRGAHMNTLVFDKKTGEMERFDPNGQTTSDQFHPRLLDTQLQKFFTIVLKPILDQYNHPEIKFFSPPDFCPKIGVQMVEAATRQVMGVPITKGFCSVWSFVYANFRLKYPERDRKVIAEFLKGDSRGNLYRYVENIILMLMEISEKLRTAKTEEEIKEALLTSTKKFGGKF